MSKSRLLVISLLPAMVASTLSSAAQDTARYRGPIIDMHMHARALDAPLTPSGCLPRPCADLLPPANAKPVLEATLEAMDRYNIVLAFLSRQPLEEIYRWIEGAPGRFIASAQVVEPDRLDPARLRREYESGRLRGMGEIGVVYRGISADDPRLAPYFALAEEFDVPVLIHLQGIGAPTPTFRISAGHPEQLEGVLRQRPRLRLYLENAGFPFLDETISLMYTFPNVYADLSTITWLIPREMFYRYFRALLDAGLGGRLMFGSDTGSRPQVIGPAIEAIQAAPFLTSEQRADIFYNNAARFLRLSAEEIARHRGRSSMPK